MAVFWNENGTWNINKTFEGGTSSNHVEFKLLEHGSGSVPTVTLESHTSNYTVHVYHERISLEEGSGTDNLRGYFGSDSYLSWLEGTNTLTIAGTLDVNGPADISGNLTGVNAITMDGALSGATTITASGEVEGGSLDINGNADISGTTAMGGNTLINAQLAVNSTSVDAANKLEVHGQARVSGTMMIGDSSISNTTNTGQLQIKNTGEAVIK